MTKGNGLPCVKCGTSDWYSNGACKECQREPNRRWKQANRDKIAEQGRRYRQANSDKLTDKDRRYRQAYPDKVAAAGRAWRQAHPDKVNAKTHRRRAKKAGGGGSYTAKEWKALCAHYGNKCLRCGRDDVKLTFDHVLPVSMGGTSDISNGQPLCGKCNSAKNNRHIDYRPDSGLLRWLQCKLFG